LTHEPDRHARGDAGLAEEGDEQGVLQVAVAGADLEGALDEVEVGEPGVLVGDGDLRVVAVLDQLAGQGDERGDAVGGGAGAQGSGLGAQLGRQVAGAGRAGAAARRGGGHGGVAELGARVGGEDQGRLVLLGGDDRGGRVAEADRRGVEAVAGGDRQAQRAGAGLDDDRHVGALAGLRARRADVRAARRGHGGAGLAGVLEVVEDQRGEVVVAALGGVRQLDRDALTAEHVDLRAAVEAAEVGVARRGRRRRADDHAVAAAEEREVGAQAGEHVVAPQRPRDDQRRDGAEAGREGGAKRQRLAQATAQ
jgi:hypothetical protein